LCPVCFSLLKLKFRTSILCRRFDILNLTPLFQAFRFDNHVSTLLELSSAVASDFALFFVPCLQHIPPLTTWLVRSSWLHSSTFFSCYMMRTIILVQNIIPKLGLAATIELLALARPRSLQFQHYSRSVA